MKICAVIPARYYSKRLLGKPLLKINNKEILLRTYERAIKVFKPEDTYVFTESDFIEKRLGKKIKNIIIQRGKFFNGTDRVSKGFSKIRKKYDGALIISCDNSYIRKDTIKQTLKTYKKIFKLKEYCGATVHKKEKSEKIFYNKSVAKIIVNKKNEVMYISRSPIPNCHKKIQTFNTHHGPVCLKINYLKSFYKIPNTNLQLSEDNEWLKLIESGFKIMSHQVKNISREINTKADLNFYKKIKR